MSPSSFKPAKPKPTEGVTVIVSSVPSLRCDGNTHPPNRCPSKCGAPMPAVACAAGTFGFALLGPSSFPDAVWDAAWGGLAGVFSGAGAAAVDGDLMEHHGHSLIRPPEIVNERKVAGYGTKPIKNALLFRAVGSGNARGGRRRREGCGNDRRESDEQESEDEENKYGGNVEEEWALQVGQSDFQSREGVSNIQLQRNTMRGRERKDERKKKADPQFCSHEGYLSARSLEELITQASKHANRRRKARKLGLRKPRIGKVLVLGYQYIKVKLEDILLDDCMSQSVMGHHRSISCFPQPERGVAKEDQSCISVRSASGYEAMKRRSAARGPDSDWAGISDIKGLKDYTSTDRLGLPLKVYTLRYTLPWYTE
ncbi:hypothetical protein BC629DRAFT_1443285 [Irpex lacteus]|nr:hypothetical protein BC629DRAFT_1443285 [Irpex lacteus]